MMTNWSDFSAEELDRRRAASNAAMREIENEKFAAWYQAKCDTIYWRQGKCCAGCDHWSSEAGMTGQCIAAGIMSGADVLKSLGWTFSSYMPAPGFPYSEAEHYCGKFQDDFDWSTLDAEYLRHIGAIKNGELKKKPAYPISVKLQPRQG